LLDAGAVPDNPQFQGRFGIKILKDYRMVEIEQCSPDNEIVIAQQRINNPVRTFCSPYRKQFNAAGYVFAKEKQFIFVLIRFKKQFPQEIKRNKQKKKPDNLLVRLNPFLQYADNFFQKYGF
jgi:hypothetical protein